MESVRVHAKAIEESIKRCAQRNRFKTIIIREKSDKLENFTHTFCSKFCVQI